MPISIPQNLRPIKEAEFRELDYAIMGAAFSIHNEYGRLLSEQLYQSALFDFCEKSTITATREVPIKVQYRTFEKTYYLDLLIGSGTIYELKATSSITPQYEAQLLNYLFLTDQTFGKIINFGAKSVESRFVSTSITNADRHRFEILDHNWKPVSP